jgi:hypothetical protein
MSKIGTFLASVLCAAGLSVVGALLIEQSVEFVFGNAGQQCTDLVEAGYQGVWWGGPVQDDNRPVVLESGCDPHQV